jgi:Zn-dependent M28 family amino/carboxypeptidase
MAENTQYEHPAVTVNQVILSAVVERLTGVYPPRNYRNITSLNRVADYIETQFSGCGYKPTAQKYTIGPREYKNILASYGPADAPRFILGAHYDVCEDQPGADDNASGIAGLLAVAGLFQKHAPRLDYRIDFAAYTLEEAPFFRSESMGSYVHARSLHDAGVKILGMACLEMIGYYTDAPKSQEYPLSIMKLFYPTRGDFIGVVGNFSSHKLVGHFRGALELAAVDVESLKAPAFLPGVDFSDHLSFWKFGYPAVMITDTAFYRNPNYHEASDVIDTLDFVKMQAVVKGLYWALINF